MAMFLFVTFMGFVLVGFVAMFFFAIDFVFASVFVFTPLLLFTLVLVLAMLFLLLFLLFLAFGPLLVVMFSTLFNLYVIYLTIMLSFLRLRHHLDIISRNPIDLR